MNLIIKKIATDFINRCIAEKGYYTLAEFERYNKIMELTKMKLYTFYKENEKVVYGTAMNGKTFFFFKGFTSKEDAKEVTATAHLDYKIADRPKAPIGMLKAEIDMVLSGEWSEID